LAVSAQQQSPPDVVRVNTELVQTSVTVVDHNGRFVDGLTKDQFALQIDGRERPISFFEQVQIGSVKEQELTAGNQTAPANPSTPVTTRGRTLVFYIDDLHLSLQSLERTRSMLNHFIDQEMSSRDQVAIASPSGQIGFLQQYTNNKAVLKAALARLNQRPYIVSGYGSGKTPMTEYIAQVIESRSDTKVIDFYVDECMKQSSLPKRLGSLIAALRATCLTQTKNSARAVLAQSADITKQTYAGLESLMQSSTRRPGRKLAFFVSDGFMLQIGLQSSLSGRLLDLISAAQKAGMVVYTIDAKGLVSGTLDATNNVPADPGGRLVAIASREIAAMQDALHALAVDTGGRALRNRNVFESFVDEVLQETSNYYLLSWRPDAAEQKEKRFRKVHVSVIGRPDLTVRLPKGYLPTVTPATTEATAISKTPARMLGDALSDYQTVTQVPLNLSLTYLNTPGNGMVLTCSTEIPNHALGFGDNGKQAANVDLAGVVLSDTGKVVKSFKNRLSADPLPSGPTASSSALIYNHPVPVAPGIYQVRVAVRDEQSGRVGSAMEWLVVPDVTKQLTLSSLLLGGRIIEKKDGSAPQVQFSVDHRFGRNTKLDFWVFVYNASRSAVSSGLSARVEVLRDGHTVVSSNQQPMNTLELGDPARIPYRGNVALRELSPGAYELRVTVSDTASGKSTTQVAGFEIQ
jgi:VWFA-related protein